MSTTSSHIRRIRFGAFEADLDTGELSRAGRVLRIQDLPFRLLAALIEQPGQVVTRAELGQRLWGNDTFVDFDAGLNTAVAKLREALEDSAEQPAFVETVPKRGYRFIGRIEAASAVRPEVGPAARSTRLFAVAAALTVVVASLLAFGAFVSEPLPAVRVAVALFDNETTDPTLDRLAQMLTDATVVRLTQNPRLAVIGNARCQK